MRLNKYINEKMSEKDEALRDEGMKEVAAAIKKNCKPYLSLLGNKEPLRRGIARVKSTLKYKDQNLMRTYGLTNVRQDREGLSNRSNTTINGKKFFDVLNDWLRQNGHADRSKSISCTSSYETASDFGSPYFVFPTGKFDYTFIRSPDFNVDSIYWAADVMETYLKYWMNDNLGEFEAMNEFDPNRAFVTNKRFNEAYKEESEIWFQAKSYYYIDGYQLNWPLIKHRGWF